MHYRLGGLLNDAGLSDNGSRSGNSNSQNTDLTAIIQQATVQVQQLQTTMQTNADTVSVNTDAQLAANASYQPGISPSGGVVSTVEQTASSALGGSLFDGLLGGLSPLISGIASLFGGGPSQPTPLTEYMAPDSQHFEEATSGGITGDAVYGPGGQPRVAPITEMALAGQSSTGTNDQSGGGTRSPGSGQQASQITVQVQAMDSQSILDRSDDIASAVRQAMLNSHPINDVINDL
jgi:hypothetical protein